MKLLSRRMRRNYALDASSTSGGDGKPVQKVRVAAPEKAMAAPSNYDELQRRRQMKKGVTVEEEASPIPPTLLAAAESGKDPEEVATRTSHSDTLEQGDEEPPRQSQLFSGVLRRRTLNKFRSWLGNFVTQKSFGPGVLEAMDGGSDEEEESTDQKAVVNDIWALKNHFLAAYLNGELDILDRCLQACVDKHGKGAYLAIAKEPGELTLEEWLQMYSAPKMMRKLQELHHEVYEEEQLRRAFTLLQNLTAGPRLQLGERRPEMASTKGPRRVRGQSSGMVIIFADFEEGASQVRWAKALGQRLVRGTEAASSGRESVRNALTDTVAKALDGLSPVLRLARAAARWVQRGLFEEASNELRLLWALAALEPKAAGAAFFDDRRPAARHLGFAIRVVCRAIVADQGRPLSVQKAETLFLALQLSAEFCRHRRLQMLTEKREEAEKEATLPGAPRFPALPKLGKDRVEHIEPTDEGDAALLECLQAKTLILATAALSALLPCAAACASDKSVQGDDEETTTETRCQLASQLLAASWRILDQAGLPGAAQLRPALCELATAAGITRPAAFKQDQEASLALRAAAVASGSSEVKISKSLLRPARVPHAGLLQILASVKEDAPKPARSFALVAKRGRTHERPVQPKATVIAQARAGLEKVTSCVSAKGEETEQLLRCAVLYGGPFLADRLSRDLPECQEPARCLFEKLRPVLQREVGDAVQVQDGGVSVTPVEGRTRRKAQIAGNSSRLAELREVRRSWDAETEMQWQQLSQLTADLDETDDDEYLDESEDEMP
ncbi:unnamed protein product [Symbiodinium sp. CCMP2456]|nr:unnamed protein product [Symbiodinium sp. CCMP2456]